jgi:hypothetical protein
MKRIDFRTIAHDYDIINAALKLPKILESLILASSKEIARPPFIKMRIDFEDRMGPLKIGIRVPTKNQFVEL